MSEAPTAAQPAFPSGRRRLRELLRLGVPLVAGMGGHALFNIVDLAMVGAYKGSEAAESLSAVGIASIVTTAPLVFMNGVSNGTGTVVARAFAAGKPRRANQCARQALLLSVVLSVLLGVVPAFFAGDIAQAFGMEPGTDAHKLTRDYLAMMSYHSWSGFLLLQVTANLRAVGMSMWTMVLLLTSNVGNIAGNWLLVFGNLGFPECGPMGAAYATVIARGVAALGGIAVSAGAHPAIRISAGGWAPRARFMWAVTRSGLPVAMQWTVRMAAVMFVLLVVAPFGLAQKAAYSVGTRLDTLVLFAGLGWGAACSALVSHAVGRGDVAGARKVTRASGVLNVATMAAGGLCYWIFAASLIRLFSLRGDEPTPPEVLEAGVRYIRIGVLSYPGLAVSMVFAHALNGAGSVKTPLVIDAAGLLLVQVPLAWVLSLTPLGVEGVWWALVVSHTLLASVYYLAFRRGAWERKRRR